MKQPNQHFIDKHTSIDDLLATLIEQNALLLDAIDVDIDDEVHFFTYPKNGTRAALAAGTTELDYEQGTVIDVDGGTSDMNSSLRRIHKPACRSIALNADQDLIIQINNKDRIPVTAGTWFKATYLRFQRVKILTTATTTNTFILACTHPNAIDISGEVLIKDTTDVWGNSVSMGLGELAVRTHAPPITFDRRGDVLRWVDFESSTPNYAVYDYPPAGLPVHGRTIARAATGDFSYYATVSNTQYINMQMYTNDFHIGRLGGQALFMSADSTYTIDMAVSVFDGTNLTYAILRYNRNTKKLQYYDDTGTYQDIATVDHRAINQNFSTVKLVADFANAKYVRATVFGSEYDISDKALRVVGNATDAHLFFKTVITGINATPSTVYIDNMILTENESA